MAQPKIIAGQIDTGSGASQLVTNSMLYTPGAGKWVQALFGPIAAANGTTVIPFDSTVPLITEGTNMGTGIITPTAATSSILIEFSIILDANVNTTDLVIAVFRGSTCIVGGVVTIDTAGKLKTYSQSFVDSPATTSAVTYTGRIGVGSAGPTWYVNSSSTGNNLGGTIATTFALEEIS